MQSKCGNCGKCEVLYSKAYCQFLRSNYGYCSIKKEVVPVSEFCDEWHIRTGRRRNLRNGLVLQSLEKGLTDLAVLRQIFTEETEKEETNKSCP